MALVVLLLLLVVQMTRPHDHSCLLFNDYRCDCTRLTASCQFTGEKNMAVSPMKPINTSYWEAFNSITIIYDHDVIKVEPYSFWYISSLFKRPRGKKDKLNFHLTFKDFTSLSIEDNAFQNTFDNQRFANSHISLEFYSRRHRQLIKLGKNVFSGLVAESLSIYCNAKSINLLQFSFVDFFNKSKIKTLRTEGFQFIPQTNSTAESSFDGRVSKLIVTKQVAVVNSEEFTFNPFVSYYGIRAHNSQRFNGSSFAKHNNLQGLDLSSSQIEISSESLRYFKHLKDLSLNVERIEGTDTFRTLNSLRRLAIGPNVKIITVEALNSLPNVGKFLKTLDLSKASIEYMSYGSRCAIVSFVLRTSAKLNVLLPDESLRSCDCYIQILNIHLKNNSQQTNNQCSLKICQFTSCLDAQWFKNNQINLLGLHQASVFSSSAFDVANNSLLLKIPLMTTDNEVLNKDNSLLLSTIKTTTELESSMIEVGEMRRSKYKVWMLVILILALVSVFIGAVIILFFVYPKINQQYKPIPQMSG